MAASVDDPRLYKYLNQGTLESIFRKTSKTRVITIYIPKREIWDKPNTRFPQKELSAKEKYEYNSYNRAIVEGLVGLHPNYVINNNKVFVEVVAYYRYDKAELNPYDLNIKRTVYRAYKQLFPPEDVLMEGVGDVSHYSKSVQLLLTKMGSNHYPFRFDVSGAPDSVWIHDTKSPNHKNGIAWEVRAYVNNIETDNPAIADFAQIKIRKLTHVDPEFIPYIANPYFSIDRQYASLFLDGGAINLQSELNKYLYYMGEEIIVSIGVTNASNRVIKKIRIVIEQILKLELWDVKEYVVIIQDKSITNEKLTIPILPRTDCWKTKIAMFPGTKTPVNPVNLVVETPNRPGIKETSEVLLAASSLNRDQLNDLYFEKKPEIDPLVPRGVATIDDPFTVRYRIVVTCEISEGVEGLEGECPKNIHDFLLCHPKPTCAPPIRVREARPY